MSGSVYTVSGTVWQCPFVHRLWQCTAMLQQSSPRSVCCHSLFVVLLHGGEWITLPVSLVQSVCLLSVLYREQKLQHSKTAKQQQRCCKLELEFRFFTSSHVSAPLIRVRLRVRCALTVAEAEPEPERQSKSSWQGVQWCGVEWSGGGSQWSETMPQMMMKPPTPPPQQQLHAAINTCGRPPCAHVLHHLFEYVRVSSCMHSVSQEFHSIHLN
ncbi:uncharacterized protein LOC111076553 [Drosophila obscura]|uniref:uncharacterized protein LOC111076553 n=1 Tax=Drosophila obscura TaxID=7282 RepID=UPI001BB14BD2|nr:uncharacterized protein LOC111076553 [Drosophila obscura]